ncbi:hypothetical protein D3C72_2550220 [compost metagenome]
MGTDEPKLATISSANILLGIAVSVSSTRLSTLSVQRPVAAASRASSVPLPLASSVATKATPTV